jgi:hypothetical protein
MDNLATTFKNIEWTLLAQQKLALLEACDMVAIDYVPELTGLLHFIDAIQDAAERDGFPVVFLTEGEQ